VRGKCEKQPDRKDRQEENAYEKNSQQEKSQLMIRKDRQEENAYENSQREKSHVKSNAKETQENLHPKSGTFFTENEIDQQEETDEINCYEQEETDEINQREQEETDEINWCEQEETDEINQREQEGKKKYENGSIEKKEVNKNEEKDFIDPKFNVLQVCNFLEQKKLAFDWVLRESIDGIAFQTLTVNCLQNWKIGPYGTCIKILSFQKWSSIKGKEFGSPLVPTPDMIRRQSLSYWGIGSEIPPSEKIVSKSKPLEASELVDRIIANRNRREDNLREKKEKKKAKTTADIIERKKSGRGYKYLISFNNASPKWVNRSGIPKRFSILVKEFDKAWKQAKIMIKANKKKNNLLNLMMMTTKIIMNIMKLMILLMTIMKLHMI